MAVYYRGQSGRRNHAFSSSHYSQSNHVDKAPESVPVIETPIEKSTAKRTENQLSRLAEEIFGSPFDSDKILVAALILLLLKEGADPKLILALGYIFM